ncbi:MAG: valine--tRNA ligase, partial [Proteobacteria bacterium]|nr:valine--tRNA ligase [Pseudomonadota bacterium]
WEVGKRHPEQLMPPINILDARGKLTDDVPAPYRGLDRFEARKQIVADLEAEGLLEKIEPNTHSVPHAQRGDAVIEPWLTDQWYVDAATLAKPALAAVHEGRTRFVPEKYANDYYRWLENIQPWCISRQLWWGHQIPAWYGPALVDGKGGSKERKYDIVPGESNQVFVALNEEDAAKQAAQFYGCETVRFAPNSVVSLLWSKAAKEKHEINVVYLWRDADVLDTWFSSALWPFSTLGWPEETKELKRYYPTSCLVTGFDIIFFWVARMMMAGVHFMKDAKGAPQVPFHDVYIHGLVRDEKGRKMSKSIGNVIDPLELIDKYGADALRFTMAALTTQGRDVKLSNQRVEGYRNFATKLWNAARFAEMNECRRIAGFDPKSAKHTINRWIAGETERAAKTVTAAIEAYKFNEAAGATYEFIWGTVCDWYVELAKPLLAGTDEAAKAETRAMTAWVLDQSLALLHPFMPFITEELWAKTGEHGPKRESLLVLAKWPELSGLIDQKADAEIGSVIRLISEIRSVRSEMNVPAAAKVPLVLVEALPEARARAERHNDTIVRLARLESITFGATAPAGSAQVVAGDTTAALVLAGIIDMGAEKARISKELGKVGAEIKKVTDRLGNPQFMARAPDDVVEELRERQTDWESKGKRLEAALKRLDG